MRKPRIVAGESGLDNVIRSVNVMADQDGVTRVPAGEFWGNEPMGDWDFLLEGMVGSPQ